MPEPLFNPNPDKLIQTYDLFGNTHQRNLKNFKFRVSVYGVFIKNNELLMARNFQINKFGLPGGGVEIGETIPDSLKREFLEETGLEAEIGDLFRVSEDFFTYEGSDAHSILIYYFVKNALGKIKEKGNLDDIGEVKFLKLSDLTDKNVQRIIWPIVVKLKEKHLNL